MVIVAIDWYIATVDSLFLNYSGGNPYLPISDTWFLYWPKQIPQLNDSVITLKMVYMFPKNGS